MFVDYKKTAFTILNRKVLYYLDHLSLESELGAEQLCVREISWLRNGYKYKFVIFKWIIDTTCKEDDVC